MKYKNTPNKIRYLYENSKEVETDIVKTQDNNSKIDTNSKTSSDTYFSKEFVYDSDWESLIHNEAFNKLIKTWELAIINLPFLFSNFLIFILFFL